jgi:hypothetical protein
LAKFIDTEKTFCQSSKEVKLFVRRALKRAPQIKRFFNLTVTPATQPIKLLNCLLKIIGIQLKKSSQNRVTFFKLDSNVFNDEIRLQLLKGFKLRNTGSVNVTDSFAKFLEKNGYPLASKDYISKQSQRPESRKASPEMSYILENLPCVSQTDIHIQET